MRKADVTSAATVVEKYRNGGLLDGLLHKLIHCNKSWNRYFFSFRSNKFVWLIYTYCIYRFFRLVQYHVSALNTHSFYTLTNLSVRWFIDKSTSAHVDDKFASTEYSDRRCFLKLGFTLLPWTLKRLKCQIASNLGIPKRNMVSLISL